MVMVPLETAPLSEPPMKVALALRPFFLKSVSASREYATAERKSRTVMKLLAAAAAAAAPSVISQNAARLTQAGGVAAGVGCVAEAGLDFQTGGTKKVEG